MNFRSRLLVTIFCWLFSAITLGSSSPLSCQNINLTEISFAYIKKKASDYIALMEVPGAKTYNIHRPTFYEDINKILEEVKTPTDFIETLKFVKDLGSLPITIIYSGGYVSVRTIAEDLIFEMNKIDWVKPLLLVKSQMSIRDEKELFLAIENWASDPYFQQGWNDIFEPIRILFYPDRILKYLDNITHNQEFLREQSKAFQLGVSFISVFNQLSSDLKIKAKFKISDLVYSDFLPRWDGDKNQVRNREIVHRLIFNEEFKEFFSQLKNRIEISEGELVKIVDSYWLKINQYPQGKRGAYSFKRVIDVAKTIQKSKLTKYMKDEHLLLYGSFVNGKANLLTSDIDLHLGPQFLQIYLAHRLTSKYHLPDTNPDSEYSKIVPTKESLEMSKILVSTERSVAQTISRPLYNPSELMTVVPVDGPFFEIQKLGYYNSLIIKITTSQISLFVVDTFGSKDVFNLRLQ